MAQQEKRGWLWSDTDKLPEKLDELERKAKNVEIQLKRFADALPDLGPEATQVGRAFTEAAKPLITLWKGRKNKFLPLSPEDATLALARARSAEDAWQKFVAREDVQDAVRGINRNVRAKERGTRNVLADARHQALARLDTPEFRGQLREQLERALEHALLMATTVRGFGDQQHRAMVRRLGIVHFVRISCEESDERAARVDAFIRQTPSPSTVEVATEAALNLLRDEISTLDPRRPQFGAPQSRVMTYMQAAVEGLLHSMLEWVREGKTPEQIGKGYFTVLGHDFTLDARPDF